MLEKKMWLSGLVLAFVSVDVFRGTGSAGRKKGSGRPSIRISETVKSS
jgi:hypothetical protein